MGGCKIERNLTLRGFEVLVVNAGDMALVSVSLSLRLPRILLVMFSHLADLGI